MEKEKQLKVIQKNVGVSIVTIVIALFLILMINLFGVCYSNQIELTQLKNNGQSQMMGYVIKTKEGKVIVIDGGTTQDASNLIQHIEQLGGKVDFWFLTHPHKDHVGAFREVVEHTEISIDHIYVSLNEQSWYEQYEPQRAEEVQKLRDVLQGEKIQSKVEEVRVGQVIKIDSIPCEILGIKNPEITTNAINNSSMVIQMKVNRKKILFLGDTGKESGEKLLTTQKEKLKSDIVQVAHHGQQGADRSLYEAIQAKIAMWPTPDWLWKNDQGGGEDTGPWKTKETRQWLEEIGTKQNMIEKDGDITIKVY